MIAQEEAVIAHPRVFALMPRASSHERRLDQ